MRRPEDSHRAGRAATGHQVECNVGGCVGLRPGGSRRVDGWYLAIFLVWHRTPELTAGRLYQRSSFDYTYGAGPARSEV